VAARQGGWLVVSQPEECAIFIFHTTQDTTWSYRPVEETITDTATSLEAVDRVLTDRLREWSSYRPGR
jgi:hypothetical protein